MWKFGFMAAMLAAAATPSLAQADAFDQGMNTMWEVLWHQAGTPTRLVRWEQGMKVRVFGVNAASHRAHTLKALRAVAYESGVQLTDVSDRADAAQAANVHIEITANSGLSDNQPCETRLEFQTETRIDSVSMQMRDKDALRCAHHEAMHVMGVRGHPAGETVLSYFPTKVDGLQPLDKVMLRAWYSTRARGGMTALEVLPVLADELVAVMPDRQRAGQARDQFLSRTITQMQAFASGEADVPEIVKRSGKSSEAGIRYGRMEMSYYLGVAYQDGVTVARDPAQAARWLQRAATMGSRPALARLGAGGSNVAALQR